MFACSSYVAPPGAPILSPHKLAFGSEFKLVYAVEFQHGKGKDSQEETQEQVAESCKEKKLAEWTPLQP